MITASHNPAEYNGIKYFGNDGYKLSDEMEEEIGLLMHLVMINHGQQRTGTVEDYSEGGQKYIQFLNKRLLTT